MYFSVVIDRCYVSSKSFWRLLSFMRLYLCSFCDYYMQVSVLTYSVLSFILFYCQHAHAYHSLQISDGS